MNEESQISATRIELVHEGRTADSGRVPVGELAMAMVGWDRLIHQAYWATKVGELVNRKRDFPTGLDSRVLAVRQGSVIVETAYWLAQSIADNSVGMILTAAVVKRNEIATACHTLGAFVATVLESKMKGEDKDLAIARLEATAKSVGLRHSRDVDESEAFLDSLSSSLERATVPLDTSAGLARLSVPSADVDIVVDERGRQFVKAAFPTPVINAAEDVIEAEIKFIRINRKTGTGLLKFTRPSTEAQVASQQYFRCLDDRMKRRSNLYTLAFHNVSSLRCRLQLRAYESGRRGHYWLLIGPVVENRESDELPFARVRGTAKLARKPRKTSKVPSQPRKRKRSQ